LGLEANGAVVELIEKMRKEIGEAKADVNELNKETAETLAAQKAAYAATHAFLMPKIDELFFNAPKADKVYADLRFENNKLFVQRFEARLGEGNLTAKAGPAAPYAAVFRRLIPDELNLVLESTNGRLRLDATPDMEFISAWMTGKVVLTGDELTQYCLWRSSQDKQRGDEWDAFLADLQPGSELVKKLDAFRFPDEPDQAGTNSQQPKIPSPSVYPRELLKAALR